MDRMFHAYKIRYERLNEFFIPMRAARKINSVNIFINLDDFYHKIHRPYTDGEFQTTGKNVSKQLVSNLMNLIGHYKNWAVKEHLQCKVFLVYTTSEVFKNGMILPKYREYYRQIYDLKNPSFFFINTAINDGFSILQVMTKYVPNVYAIDSGYLEPSIIPLYLAGIYDSDYNIIVSKDDYDLQYVATDKWGILIPKGDHSSLAVKGNVWDYVRIRAGIRDPFYFHPTVLLWALAIMGDKYRSIPKLTRTGWKTVLQYLREASAPYDDDSMLDLQLQRVVQYIDKKKIETTSFNDNLYCFSAQQQVDAMLNSDRAIIAHQLSDMDDHQTLYRANETVFKEFPINLTFLLREAPPPGSVPHDDYFWRYRNYGKY